MKRIATTIILALVSIALVIASGTQEKNEKINVISREEGSGTRGAFVELTGVEEKIDGKKVDQTTLDAEIASSTSVVLTTVEGDKNAIGYISLGSLKDSVKALSVDGVYPSVSTVKSGEYKISRPFVMAYKALSPVAEDFLGFVMGKTGQDIVEKKGYIRVDGEDNKAYQSSSITGTLRISGSSSVYPVMEVLVEAYKAANPGVEVTLMQSDSTTGVNDAISGKSDIGLSSRALKDSEVEKGLSDIVLAMDGIAVIVNKENKTDGLSSSVIRDIYKGIITTWEGL
ncbi:MAG: substrate-binding domain-containing protein [Candidatus Ornithospirochaeta sp.]